MSELIAVLGVGFFLGMRHATDPDHVVAVTAIVSRERSTRGAVAIGALWGVGHTAALVVIGVAMALFGLVIPPRLGLSLEMCVAAMLVLLGAINLSSALRRGDAGVSHHASPLAPRPSGWLAGKLGLARPLAIGVLHGASGSAAVALLVVAALHGAGQTLVYLVVFGVGTVLGMLCLTAAMAGPIVKAASSARTQRTLLRLTGLLSVGFGLFLAYRVGVVDGLFAATPSWSPR